LFHNSEGSPQYREFVGGLGWTIDLKTHPGYVGGLERNSLVGDTAPYYATPTMEVIFHDVARMPTNPRESQQIHKVTYFTNSSLLSSETARRK
jgi:hypothetical protein